MSFRGPIDTFDNADALLGSIKGLAQIVTGAERRGLIADGNQVAVVYDLYTGAVPTAPVAEWYRVEQGKIASMEAFFDARPFAPPGAPTMREYPTGAGAARKRPPAGPSSEETTG